MGQKIIKYLIGYNTDHAKNDSNLLICNWHLRMDKLMMWNILIKKHKGQK